MINTGKLAGKTLFITGASRGIGKAIALKAAKDGANIVIAAKTGEPHPKLPGTIYTAAKEIENAGGKALPCIVDVRDENQIKTAVQQAVDKFGGIDILVNNASAISLTQTGETDMKRFDLMMSINTRGTFLTSKICLPFLKKSSHAHILNISPPLNLTPHWFAMHVAYTMAKYGMSMCVLGMAEEFKKFNIGVNALWPATAIHTAAMEMLTGPESDKYSRKPDIMADAAYEVLSRDPKNSSGNFFIDEDVLKSVGVNDLTHYACHPENANNLMPDFFLNVSPEEITKFATEGSHSAEAYKAKNTDAQIPSTSTGEKEQIPELFKKIETFITPEVMKKTNAIFEFEVTGAEAGHWFLDLKNDNGNCGKGKSPNPPDAILKMDSRNFTDMFAGKLKPASAFMMGKLKISGDMQKAMKLEKLMSALKSKL